MSAYKVTSISHEFSSCETVFLLYYSRLDSDSNSLTKSSGTPMRLTLDHLQT